MFSRGYGLEDDEKTAGDHSFKFTVGDNSVIRGLNDAIPGMQGERETKDREIGCVNTILFQSTILIYHHLSNPQMSTPLESIQTITTQIHTKSGCTSTNINPTTKGME